MRTKILSAVFLVSSFLASTAWAQDDAPSSAAIKKAAAAYDLGRERYREGQYTEAAEHFEAANESAPSASALRLAIFARKEAGELDRALTHAALALELYPNEEKLLEEAEAIITEEAAGFARLNITCDISCELVLNNRIVPGQASQYRVVYASPGTSLVRASWSEGRTRSEDLELQAGGEQDVNFSAPPVATAAPSSSSEEYGGGEENSFGSEPADTGGSNGWHPAVFWTGVGLTAAGGAAIVGLGIYAINNPGRDVITEKCVSGDKECPEYKEGKKNETYVNVAVGATVALGVFTITSAFLTDWGGKETLAYSKGDLSIRPTFAVGRGASLGAMGTF